MDSDEVLTVVCLIRSQALLVLLEGDVGDAERFAHLVVRHFHREIDGTVAGAILIAA
jgi:hypothetical protein